MQLRLAHVHARIVPLVVVVMGALVQASTASAAGAPSSGSSAVPPALSSAITSTLGAQASQMNASSPQEVTAPDGAPGDQFGYWAQISGSGHVAIVGAPDKNGQAGVVYIYDDKGGSWGLVQELQAPDAAPGDRFGGSVSLDTSGDVALIGAPGKNGSEGAAYAYVKQGNDTWVFQQEFQAPDGSPNDHFGYSVSLDHSGDTALISAPYKNVARGAAYVFTDQSGAWVLEQELQAPDGAPFSYFGWDTGLDAAGDEALIGAPGQASKGAAYVFTEQAGLWVLEQELQAPDGAPGDNFGAELALSGSGQVALVGALYKSGFKGAAYVFSQQGGTWSLEQELQPPDGAPGDQFGDSDSLSNGGNKALIGAQGKNGLKGVAYYYVERGGTWSLDQEVQAPDGAPGDEFGWITSLSNGGNEWLITAPFKNGSEGVVYFYG